MSQGSVATSSVKPPLLPPYVANKESQFSFLTGMDFPEKHNVAWRIELAEDDASNPLIEPKYAWDNGSIASYGTVMRDPTDQQWKMWYVSRHHRPTPASGPATGWILTYAESPDGARWRRPQLDVSPFQGHKSNILLNLDSGGLSQQASVIVHPDAPREYRYEMFIFRWPNYEGASYAVSGFPLASGETKHTDGIYRYHSADGKHWKPWEKIELDTRDSIWVSQLPDGSYQALSKICMPAPPGGVVPYDCAVGECRILVRRTSPNGSDWSPYQLAVTPDWQDSPDTQFMELMAMPQRGGFIGLLTVYHAMSQSIDIQFAASRDGKTWWRPDRRACVPLKPLGDPGGGMIWPMQPAVQHNGRMYLYYSAQEGLHNDYLSTKVVERARQGGLPTWPHYWTGVRMGQEYYSPIAGLLWSHGVMCRSSWTEGRLWAAVTASGGPLEGMLGTNPLAVGGKCLRVNAVTVQDGKLEAELLDGDEPIPGFTRADCIPLQGDHESGLMRWKGGYRCPAEEVRVRFYLNRARLYSCDWTAEPKHGAGKPVCDAS
jgi:hypothetical protein